MVDYAEIVSNIKTCKDWLEVFNRPDVDRSEERRVGKEWRSRWSPEH